MSEPAVRLQLVRFVPSSRYLAYTAKMFLPKGQHLLPKAKDTCGDITLAFSVPIYMVIVDSHPRRC